MRGFLARQWSDYPAKHRRRVNLVIHIVLSGHYFLNLAGTSRP